MAANKDSNATKDTTAKGDAGAAEDIQVATSYDFSPDDTVTLIVGAEQKRMLVHGTYLTRDSDFFKAALKKEWVEGETRMIKLPEEDAETMAHYVTFVYHNKPPFKGVTPRERGHFDARWPVLINLYLYGERFLCRPLQNAVIRGLLRLTRVKGSNGSTWSPTRRNVERVYDGTPKGSPMRRLMVDIHITHGTKDWMWEDANAKFLMDVAKAFYEKIAAHKAFEEFRLKELDAKNYLIDH